MIMHKSTCPVSDDTTQGGSRGISARIQASKKQISKKHSLILG